MPASLVKRKDIVVALTRAGFVEPRREARELIAASRGDPHTLHCWVARRLDGEPLEWLTGYASFLGHRVRVGRGVYVPRPQTEQLARRAIERLPDGGLAADLATGSGAIAVALQNARPTARVVATDIDANACSCARSNRVEVFQGDLGNPLPRELLGRLDAVVAVVPYVPTDQIAFLPRDTRRYEPLRALDGGEDGLTLLREVVWWASVLLHQNGALLVELGADQDQDLRPALADAGFGLTDRFTDDDGDLRGIEATLLNRPAGDLLSPSPDERSGAQACR
jgi:release factor glutamine methyltransferase